MPSFLDKLKDSVDSVVSGAQDKIQEAQLRAQLKTIEREKADQMAALGSALYAMHRVGDIRTETLESQFEALAATDVRLDEKQREIDECIAAGGAVTTPPVVHTTSADRHCQCGAILSPAARFCPECGKPNAPEGL